MPHRPGPNQTQATITVQRLPPGAVPAAPAFYGDGNYEYKEGFIVPEPLVDGKIETLKERARVTNQVYRSAQLIYPGPKATHDCVLGSYLRHVREPYFSTVQVPYGPDMHTRVAQTVQQRAFPHQTPDGRRIIHQNYNNPGGLYSAQNASDAFALHTGMHSPRSVGNPASKLADITMSPTYQLLHAGESIQQHSPSLGQVYSPTQSQGQGPWKASIPPRSAPTQSTSFNTIMHAVCPPGTNM
ncbi:uncharacterized protein LOC111265350 isoform X1 [Varroa jacobsoni]|uniref:Zasp-like motif domain-containing protein n=1 Tax=Varroa destructor TaxID=109461 RepID=A0A7M7KIX2_VARDE|nr:uncharacterized protein LOC111252575 isoform X1 [Varroa destructor]XP_022666473.1 uncharacterized protein LOC111252575 isoform X1 [Varroa destructor]XP_022666481.1 uncharacterized protein LOC111252575 isoform X1 [Varroa destructor]XP_022697680.1 uncharacterized protein LOC111265350 isoform X1 [Varroa jacobsoni]XP_022697681.1 uncharacterized protein LOC111265350 isoform X1 [Varroa jacobsoni]